MKSQFFIFILLSFFLGITPLEIFTQNKENISMEFITTVDNDVFIPYTNTDKDYSFGLLEEVRIKRDTAKAWFFKNKVQSLLYGFKGGIMGFTPDYTIPNDDPNYNIGRPFAAWLFLEHRQYYVFEKSFLIFAIQTGVIGPNAYGGNFQNWFHREFNAGPRVLGWENQIPNSFGINVYGNYDKSILTRKKMIIYNSYKASLGNISSYVEPSFIFRLGRFTSIKNFSRLTDEKLENKKSQWFLDAQVGLLYVIYDATLQGNPFRNDVFFKHQSINGISIIAALKFTYAADRFSISMSNNFRSSALDEGDRFSYGSLVIVYGI